MLKLNRRSFASVVSAVVLCAVGLGAFLSYTETTTEARSPSQRRLLLFGGSSSVTPSLPVTGSVLAVVPAWTYNSSQEITGVQGITAAAALDDLVGQTDDYSAAAHFVAAAGTGNRPVLGTAAGMDRTLVCDGNKFLVVENSAKSFKSLHETGVGTIAVWIEPSSVTGSAAIILDSTNNVETQRGFVLRRDTTGLLFKLTKGTSGTIGEKSLASVLDVGVGGWCVIRFNGTGATGRMRFGTGSDQSFTLGASFGTGDAGASLGIGGISGGGGTRFSGDIGPVMIWPRDLTDNEVTTLLAWNPAATDACPYVYDGGALTGTTCRTLLQMFDATYNFTDTGGTANVASNGDGVKLVKHYGSVALGVDLNRNASSAGVTDPVWTTGVLSNTPCIRFNNGVTTDRLAFAQDFKPSRHWTQIVIVRNLDATDGSHALHRNGVTGSYLTIVGTNYAGGGTNPRWSYHDSTSSGPGGSGLRGESLFNTITVTRNGQDYVGYGNGVQDSNASTTGFAAFNSVGGNNVSDTDWNIEGYEAVVAELPFTLTAGQAATLKTHYEALLGFGG